MIVVGHRGAAALEPENTLRSIARGIACADIIEIDVRLTSDAIPVLMHDRTLDRTTSGSGRIRDKTLAELKALDAGAGDPIPTLQEVLSFVNGRCAIFIELKEADSSHIVAEIIRDRHKPDVRLVSFDLDALIRAREIIPDIPVGIIYSREIPNPVGAALAMGSDLLLPKFTLSGRKLVEKAHLQAIKVIPWTLDEPSGWEDAIAIGADGFVTNDPCAARSFLNSRVRD